MITNSLILRCTLLSSIALMLAGCENFIYGIDVNNYGPSGVLILQIGDRKAQRPHASYVKKGVTFPIIRGLTPRNEPPPSGPLQYRNPASSYGRFMGHDDALPEEVEVVWQLAEPSDCHKTEWSKGELDLRTCQRWTPLPDRIYRKTLDMAAIRESDAYKKTGKRNPNVGGSRYTLRLNLIFNEDQLTVEADNGSTNPWR